MDSAPRASLPGNRRWLFGGFLRSSRGQAAVELGLVLPLVLILLFIIIDFGVGLSRWVVITNAAREGARLGAVGADPLLEVKPQTIAASSGLLDSSNVTVDYQNVDGTADPGEVGDAVVVKVTYEYALISPLKVFLSLGWDSLTLSACSNMRLERGVDGASSGGTTC